MTTPRLAFALALLYAASSCATATAGNSITAKADAGAGPDVTDAQATVDALTHPTDAPPSSHPHDANGTEASAPVDAGAPSEDHSEWLDGMNAARAAVGEKPLTWDPIAAKVALAYANQCDYEHNENASAQYAALGGSGGLGENISAGTDETAAEAVTNWISEASSYDHGSNTCALFEECGHYTQIVWSTTTEVGCAYVTCTTGSPFDDPTWDFAVCDFNPPGNYEGEAPY